MATEIDETLHWIDYEGNMDNEQILLLLEKIKNRKRFSIEMEKMLRLIEEDFDESETLPKVLNTLNEMNDQKLNSFRVDLCRLRGE